METPITSTKSHRLNNQVREARASFLQTGIPQNMNKQLISILIGLLWTSSLFGQVQNEVLKVLEKKDFVEFKKYADNLSSKEKMIRSHWECLRDLTPDFQEGVFIFERSVPKSDNPAISSVFSFRLTIISTTTKIVSYELCEKKSKKVGDKLHPYFESIDSFKDEKEFEILKSSFKTMFQAELNEHELFVTDFVFGSHCGFAGLNPEGRQQINEWVKSKNKLEILRWLKSVNTEKQIYAVDGLYQLKRVGIPLTEEEEKIINFICNKNGTMYVCSGCIHSRKDIKTVAKTLNQ